MTLNTLSWKSLTALGLSMAIGIGVGASFVGAAGSGEKEAPEIEKIADDYKKHYDAYKAKKYEVKTYAKDHQLITDPSNPISKGIMGTWVIDKTQTELTGNRARINLQMKFTPTEKISDTIVSDYKKMLTKITDEAEESENERSQAKAKRLKGSLDKIYAYGNLEVSYSKRNRTERYTRPFMVISSGGLPCLVFYESDRKGDLEVGILAYRHSKSGKLDSLGLGESDEINFVLVRASAREEVAEILSGEGVSNRGDRGKTERRSKSYEKESSAVPMKTARPMKTGR